uniref:Kinetochore associated 1 n=1 Tax=Crocodylus porosus TaxID=8502 RepID=A0A7M4F655_CROPO
MWNEIDLLINDDTGSGRLSAGSGQECGTALYQVDTLVKITSSDKVLVNPELHAVNSTDGCIIVTDRSVALLDSICQSLQMHIQFDTNVDVVGLCQEGQFLVVGERSGNLHLIHVPSQQTLLTKQLKLVCLCPFLGVYHMFILTSNGCFCIMCLPLLCFINNFFSLFQLQGEIKTAFISTKEYHAFGCLNFIIGDSKDNIQLIIGGKGNYVLSRWEVDTTKRLVSVQSFADSSIIKGKTMYFMWDVYSLTLIWDWPSIHIKEFLLTTESDSSSVTRQGIADLKLITLTIPDNKQKRNLLVFSLPAMHLLYSLEVSEVSSLVQSGISTDIIYFLEGIPENRQKSPEGSVSVVVMRSLTEALPENRLSRLLHKHKFTEAENFAIQFGLDVELVYKVKASTFLERLASASIASCGQTVWLDLVSEAKENLQQIQDNQFVVEYCINAPWPTYETTQEMLNYAKFRVLRAQARLTTFYGAFGPEKFSGIAWTEFLNNEDLFKNVLYQLEEGSLPCAQYLWLRHQAEFESSFDEKTLVNMLNTIRTTVPPKELSLWFKNVVIPFVRRVVPNGEKTLAKWLEQAARNLELTDKANWPENGLNMAEVFFTSKSPDELGLASSCHWIPSKCGGCEEVYRLKKLVLDLQELVNLYRKYSCRLALSDFEKENASTIVFRMFDKILAPELVPSMLKKFIKPYIQEHNLQEDELFLQYIKDLLERCCTRSTSVFETAWEAKAIAVIGCISDTDLKFDAVLQIMHGAVVPWSAAVEQLVKQHLEMKHSKVKLLQESYKLMEMKKLLRAYGIRDANLLKDKQMIMRLARYILKQDTPTCLEDALKIVAACMLPSVEVYILRMVDLIDKDRGEESLNLLKSLPVAEAEEIAERLTIWARLTLQKEPNNSEEDECEMNLKMFETLASLQEDFDIFISVKDYGNPSLMSQLLEEYIKAYETIQSMAESRKVQATNHHSEEGETKNCSTKSRLYRLALLLQKTEQELGAKLALRALDTGKIEEAIKICRDLYEHHCNEETGKTLFLACQKLCHMLGADVPMITPKELNLPAVIDELACQAATICSPDLLLDSLELCQYTLIAKDIYGQCQIENYGFIAKTASFGADKDPYEEWIYDDFFSEDGIVLEPQMVLPVAYETVSSLMPFAENKIYPLDCTCLANCPFVKGNNLLLPARTPICALLQNLTECSQYELALQLIVSSFGSCLQHCVTNNMNMSLSEKVWRKPRLGFAEYKLWKSVFNCRLIDLNLALGYCTILPKEDMFKKLWDVINNTWQNYNKILAVARVGAQLASHYGEAEEREKFQELIIDAEWGIQLGKFGISFQFVFREPSIRKRELLRILVQNPTVDTNLLLKYCSTYMLDSDTALQLCIETLVLQSANINHVEGDSAGNTEKLPPSILLAKALGIIPLLKSTQDLVISLGGILNKLDPYDYETIENVLRVIQSADEKSISIQVNQALSLLKHLESYKRISPPVDLEHQYVLENAIALSPAAQTRLPFHLIFFRTTQCFWSIISAELSEESFPTLLLISKLMKVSLDTLYMSAARHVFEKKLKPKVFEMRQCGCSSVINKETTKTVQTIHSYLLSIINPEWAVAIAHKIAQELPTGPDQIQALKVCLSLAEKWINNTTSHQKAEVLLKKLRMQYQRSATENVLITHKLNTTEHLKLVGKPANLIVLLYEHSSIDERIQNPTGKDYPDIHVAAKEVAEINNIDMNKIWDILLEKWLCPNMLPTDVSMDFSRESYILQKHVIHLLQPRPMDYSSRLLFAITTSATSPIGVNQLTFAHRSRALKCLIYLADTNTVESLFKKPIEKVKYFLKCFIYLAEFEILNIPYTYESFHKSPKEGMIKGLWKNHSHEPTAVRLVTELSLEYKVYDPQLWSCFLQKLLGFKMIRYLRKILIAITGIHSLWQVCESFMNTFSAPTSFRRDLVQYAQLDLPAFALGCLLLIPQSEKREQQIQGFLSSSNPEAILQQVDECMNTGEVAGFASQIRCLVLDNIINEKQYEKFSKSKHFPLLKLQVMNNNRVKELVEYLINDAATLITEYQERCGNSIPADMLPCDILKVNHTWPKMKSKH